MKRLSAFIVSDEDPVPSQAATEYGSSSVGKSCTIEEEYAPMRVWGGEQASNNAPCLQNIEHTGP